MSRSSLIGSSKVGLIGSVLAMLSGGKKLAEAAKRADATPQPRRVRRLSSRRHENRSADLSAWLIARAKAKRLRRAQKPNATAYALANVR